MVLLPPHALRGPRRARSGAALLGVLVLGAGLGLGAPALGQTPGQVGGGGGGGGGDTDGAIEPTPLDPGTDPGELDAVVRPSGPPKVVGGTVTGPNLGGSAGVGPSVGGPGPPGPPPPPPVSPGLPPVPAVLPPVAGPAPGPAPLTGPTTDPAAPLPTTTFPMTWNLWWGYNREAYLNVAGALPSIHPLTGGDRVSDDRRGGLSEALVRRELVPALFTALEGASDPWLEHHLLVALGRVAGDDPAVHEALVARLARGHAFVREGAVAALGASGTGAAALTLTDLVHDDPAARGRLGAGSVPTRLRGLAALALGTCAARSGQDHLVRYALHQLSIPVAAGRRAESAELRAACVSGMGLALAQLPGAPGPGADPAVPFAAECELLLEVLEDRRESDAVLVQVPGTLARLARRAPQDLRTRAGYALVQLVDKRQRAPLAVRRAAAVALGAFGDADDDLIDGRVRTALAKGMDDTELGVRGLCAVALGRVGARPGTGAGEPLAARDEVERELSRALRRAGSQETLWFALGLGVLGAGLDEHGLRLDDASREQLERLLGGARSPVDLPPLALAAGLARTGGEAAHVRERFGRLNQEGSRGAVATALALMGDRSSVDLLRSSMRRALHDVEMLEGLSVARAVLEDRSTVDDVLSTWDECGCPTTRFAVALGLGRVGDVRAVAPMLAVLRDAEGYPAHARASAAHALGRLGDLDATGWVGHLAVDYVHPASPQLLTDPLGRGLLEHL